MADSTHRRPAVQRAVLGHLDDRVDDGEHYVKSRHLSTLEEFSEYEADAIGRAVSSLAGANDHPFRIERYSDTGCVTWRVARDEDDSDR